MLWSLTLFVHCLKNTCSTLTITSKSNQCTHAVSITRLHSLASTATSKSPLVENTVEKPRKYQYLLDESIDDRSGKVTNDRHKSGNDLRKENREKLRIQRVKNNLKYINADSKIHVETQHNEATLIKRHKKDINQNDKNRKIRFRLGNGVEALTAESLISLVQSTVPYFFPNFKTRLVLDEDDAFVTDKRLQDNNDIMTSNSNNMQENISGRLSSFSKGSDGWLQILQAPLLLPNNNPTPHERIDYFTLCLAAHFATCASYVPTDVDSKIRGHCWYDPDPEVIYEQYKVVRNALLWNVDDVNKRILYIPNSDCSTMPISGHNGEFLGIFIGAYGGLIRHGFINEANEVNELINKELEREASIFQYISNENSSIESNTLLLKLAILMTHNVGDIDQGLSYYKNNTENIDLEQINIKYSRLSHERYARYDGAYGKAKVIYKELVSTEGHRNYPLREAKCLRKSNDLALPFAPWLEDWGKLVANHPMIDEDDLTLIVKQLIRGCDSQSKAWCVPNQVGYYRALNGIASSTNFERLTKSLDKECKAFLKSHDMRHHLGLSPDTFSLRIGQRARDMLDTISI